MTVGIHIAGALGIRSTGQVRAALDRLAASEKPGSATRGAIAAYRWALDPDRRAPISQARAGDTGPGTGPVDEALLMAEERAALALARDTGQARKTRAFARGAAQALGWILGFSDARL